MKSLSSYLEHSMKESFTINEVGMSLRPDHRLKIKERLQLLEEKAPALSSIKLEIVKERHKTRAVLSISGASKKIRAELTGNNPWILYKRLEQKVDRQILEWKKGRFLNQTERSKYYWGFKPSKV